MHNELNSKYQFPTSVVKSFMVGLDMGSIRKLAMLTHQHVGLQKVIFEESLEKSSFPLRAKFFREMV